MRYIDTLYRPNTFFLLAYGEPHWCSYSVRAYFFS